MKLEVNYPMREDLQEAIEIATGIAIAALEDSAVTQIKEAGIAGETAHRAVSFVTNALFDARSADF